MAFMTMHHLRYITQKYKRVFALGQTKATIASFPSVGKFILHSRHTVSDAVSCLLDKFGSGKQGDTQLQCHRHGIILAMAISTR